MWKYFIWPTIIKSELLAHRTHGHVHSQRMLTREQNFTRLLAQILIYVPLPSRATDQMLDWIPKSVNHTDMNSPNHGLLLYLSILGHLVSFPFSPERNNRIVSTSRLFIALVRTNHLSFSKSTNTKSFEKERKKKTLLYFWSLDHRLIVFKRRKKKGKKKPFILICLLSYSLSNGVLISKMRLSPGLLLFSFSFW